MNQLQSFSHSMFGNLEIFIKDGKEQFPATYVASLLGYANPTDAINRHCKKEGVAFHEVPTTSGIQNKKFINEPNLYRLITKSKLPQAEQFEKWVFEEVLPAIRKDGGYIHTTQEDTDEDILARAVLVAQKAIEKKDKMIEQQRQLILQQEPLVTFAEACMQSNKSIKVAEVAKLAAKHGIKTGQTRLFKTLRDWGMIFKNSTEPTQKAIERGYFEVVQGVKEKPNGDNFTWITPYVTPKGQAYIIDRLKKEVDLQVI